MAELLLELLSEEIPARMQVRAADDLKRLVGEGLKAKGLTFADIRSFATPRRLALVVKGLPQRQPDVAEERKGPKEGAPDAAVQGFLKSAGLTSLDQAELRDTDKGRVYFAVKKIAGRATAEVLPEVIDGAIKALPWPKSMRWAENQFRWVRPLQSILALFEGKALSGALDLSGATLSFGGTTLGHRDLGHPVIEPKDFRDYREKLKAARVILDGEERKAAILSQARALAAAANLKLREDAGLLDEVAGLIEWPVVLPGRFEEAFLSVPAEILVTSMRAHQKYFALEKNDGSLANAFLLVANVEAPEGSTRRANIIAGNERVLRARLSDAKFFWDQDLKTTLSERVPGLKDIVFHAKLGTLDQRIARIEALAVALAEKVPGADKDQVRAAARLCKADLLTGVVGEFPELQGIMGRYYALAGNEPAAVANAIAEHYSPKGPEDRCPTAPVSICVALAEKLDTLVGFWAIDEKPTGSKDPFALRRAALGIIRLIVENKLRLSLRKDSFEPWLANFTQTLGLQLSDEKKAGVVVDLQSFFRDRISVVLKDKGVRHDLVLAVFEKSADDQATFIDDDLVRLLARVEALGKFLSTDDGANLLVAYRRAANIVRIEEKKDKAKIEGAPDQHLFQQHEEQALWQALQGASSIAKLALGREDFQGAMAALAGLRATIDAFFDKVTVNAPDPGLRANRLKLLKAIQGTLDQVAIFEQVEG